MRKRAIQAGASGGAGAAPDVPGGALRVGFDTVPAALSGSGVGRYPAELEAALRERDDVELAPLAPGRGDRAKPPATRRARILQGLAREGLYYPAGLARQARAAGVDVVHCPAPFAPLVADRPLVLTIHDLLPLRHPELFPRLTKVHTRLLFARSARRATRIITGSEHTRGELGSLLGIGPERVTVTPYGVDARFRPEPPPPGWAEERLGVRGRYALCVGNLEPRKNLATAVRAFEAAGVEDCSLVVVGARGWRNEEFERVVERTRAHVVVAGYVEDDELVPLYSGAECLVFPSLYEGFGFPPLEAMACGTPVISSDRTSLPEVVGDAGVLVDPHDEGAIAEAIRALLGDESRAREIGERGRERAAAFTWERTAAATVDAYRAALG